MFVRADVPSNVPHTVPMPYETVMQCYCSLVGTSIGIQPPLTATTYYPDSNVHGRRGKTHFFPNGRTNGDNAEVGHVRDPVTHAQGCLHLPSPAVSLHGQQNLFFGGSGNMLHAVSSDHAATTSNVPVNGYGNAGNDASPMMGGGFTSQRKQRASERTQKK